MSTGQANIDMNIPHLSRSCEAPEKRHHAADFFVVTFVKSINNPDQVLLLQANYSSVKNVLQDPHVPNISRIDGLRGFHHGSEPWEFPKQLRKYRAVHALNRLLQLRSPPMKEVRHERMIGHVGFEVLIQELHDC